MAVARINHDLRNMLSAAQLISDRLATIPIARPTPRASAGGDARPGDPVLPVDLDLRRGERTGADAACVRSEGSRAPDRRDRGRRRLGAIRYAIDIPPKFELFADPDHVQRIIENLGRNAAQALQIQGPCGERPKAIRFAAIRTSAGLALIEVSDTARLHSGTDAAHLRAVSSFQPRGRLRSWPCDRGRSRRAQRRLDYPRHAQADDFYCGARFLIALPTPQDARKP